MTSENLQQFSQEYIDYDDGPGMIASCVVVGILALFIVCLRLWARKMKGATFGLEDWLIIVCVVRILSGTWKRWRVVGVK